MRDRRPAFAARFDAVAARREGFGKRDERGLGPAEWSRLYARAVEWNAVIGHHDVRHSDYSLSSWAFRYDRIG